MTSVSVDLIWSRNSAVGITTGYGLDGLMVRVRVPGGESFLFPPCHEVGGFTVIVNIPP
jgi:hypothetical protein